MLRKLDYFYSKQKTNRFNGREHEFLNKRNDTHKTKNTQTANDLPPKAVLTVTY